MINLIDLIDNWDEIVVSLKEIWDYMKLNQPLEKCDLIIGCGCANLEIPVKCAKLYNEGYANKILFTGGYGKITAKIFDKPESMIYKEIAILNGVLEEDILIEDKSTNTGDNFRFAKDILNRNKIKHDKILIVHKPFSERRTISSAKAILKNSKLIITSLDTTFEKTLEQLKSHKYEKIVDIISTIVGDVQRMIIYPQFGWQVECDVPEEVISAYRYLKDMGFDKYIFSEQEIKNMISLYGIIDMQKENYFN